MSAHATAPRLDDLFRACDTKGVGHIGPEEFRDLCTKYGISDKDSDVIFNDLDHDGDGQIDFEDFCYGFRDFLTPGSRRGSLQVSDLSNTRVLKEMEKKHLSAKNAWKAFTSNVGSSNIKPFLHSGEQLQGIIEELRHDDSDASLKLEKALSGLISDVHSLQEEYRSLESSFRKERETHAAQLAALGEELDLQLAKTEAKVKAEALHEAQKQMDSERKRITTEMENQMASLSSQMRTFQKVEEWLATEESREKKYRNQEELSKLQQAEDENRKLRCALVEAQMKATLLQAHLAEKQSEYADLYHELHSEKAASTDYKNQCDLMQNHLAALSDANRMLSDSHECFTSMSIQHGVPSLQQEMMGRGSKTNSLDRSGKLRVPSESRLSETDKGKQNEDPSTANSGQGTLLEELRSQGDGSPLPSGIWSAPRSGARTPEPADFPVNPSTLDIYQRSNFSKAIEDPPRKDVGPERTFKVILAGDAAVGKSTFIERICNGYFVSNLSSTIGVDFRVKTMELDGKCIALQLWDTAGQERFRSLTKSYFRRADGVILMYDVTNERTFVSIRQWIQNVEEGAGRKVPIVLCGNKVDLREEVYKGSTCVNSEDGKRLARQCGAFFIETSPKTGQNVTSALTLLAKEMSVVEDAELKSSLKLAQEDEEKAAKRGCCGGVSKPSTADAKKGDSTRL